MSPRDAVVALLRALGMDFDGLPADVEDAIDEAVRRIDADAEAAHREAVAEGRRLAAAEVAAGKHHHGRQRGRRLATAGGAA